MAPIKHFTREMAPDDIREEKGILEKKDIEKQSGFPNLNILKSKFRKFKKPYGLLIGGNDLVYIPDYKPFKSTINLKAKSIRRFSPHIGSLYERPEDIYVGRTPVGIHWEDNNFFGLRNNLEKKVNDEEGYTEAINTIEWSPKKGLLIGCPGRVELDNGKFLYKSPATLKKHYKNGKIEQLNNSKDLKNKNIFEILDMVSDPYDSNSLYLEVEKFDKDTVTNNGDHKIMKYNLKDRVFENYDLRLAGYESHPRPIKDKGFIHIWGDRLKINNEYIEGTERKWFSPLEDYSSLEIISRKEDELYCVVGERKRDYDSVAEYKIDLNKKTVLDFREIYELPFEHEKINALQPIRNKENHYWLMEQVNKNQKQR